MKPPEGYRAKAVLNCICIWRRTRTNMSLRYQVRFSANGADLVEQHIQQHLKS